MRRSLSVMLLAMLAGSAHAEEYPTLERVDHVLTCMREHGGQTVDNMYDCACEIDVIAQKLSFDEFTEARTFEIYKRMPGERGGLFRDDDQGKSAVGKLDQARAEARKRCFIGKKIKKQELPPGPPAPVGADAATSTPAPAAAPR